MANNILNPRVMELLKFAKTHQRHTEALVRATGENFNVFKILGMEASEVRTHSAFLGELLNPLGLHGQGCLFLNAFLSSLAESNCGDASFARKIDEFHRESATLKLEAYIGQINTDYTEGGRIDIVLTDENHCQIFIENKVFAADQKNQMLRYHGYNKKAALIYLTRNGEPPSEFSKGESDFYVHPISYSKHILPWLETCRKEAACLPAVREIIVQYINLIKRITNQSTTIAMNKELITEIVSNKENLAAFFMLRDAGSAVQTELIARLDAQLDGLAQDLGLKRPEQSQKNDGFYFTTPELTRRNLQIGFALNSAGYRDFFFGFRHERPCPIADNPAASDIYSEFKKHFNNLDEPNNWWPASAWWDGQHRNWDDETFKAIYSGQFAGEIKAKLEEMANIARKVCSD